MESIFDDSINYIVAISYLKFEAGWN